MIDYPDFFDLVPKILLQDPLAAFLGVSANGQFEYCYLDAVKLAGHSCPTVAAAWNMTRLALAKLYENEIPRRGNIQVRMRGNCDLGVTGVIANVVSMITGAAAEGGFKGIGGRFTRQSLMQFGAEIPLELRFTRLDTMRTIDIACNTAMLSASPEIPGLLLLCLEDDADPAIRIRFGRLWQDRVRRLLLEHADDPEIFTVREQLPGSA